MLIFILLILSLQILADSSCFLHNPPGEEDLLRIEDRQDCLRVARLMIAGDKAGAPMLFTRKKGIGFEVPHIWALKGTCYISIDMMEDDDEEVFSLVQMALTVAIIIHDCVDNPDFDRLGGKQECGPHRRINVEVAGKEVDAIESNITMANTALFRMYRNRDSSPHLSSVSKSFSSGSRSQGSGSWVARKDGTYAA